MKPGEELTLGELEKLDMGHDFKLALSRAAEGGNVYLVGPPGSGKTAMLRKLGLYLSRLGRGALYLKLEWVKYGWSLSDYVKHYGDKSRQLLGGEIGDVVLLDDGELLWGYGSAYRNIVRDVRGRQIVGAFREFDVDAATLLFGDGLTIYIQRHHAPREAASKVPLGLAFLNKTVEITVI
ncbi:ATP-binding protein [Pyrobaculum neutrophilum]|uniref:AAA ATPase n=1 Tax=Pyrobaculum neutrophilum (strain DSM 2338 / JCM 9278 / NBRC 100436 / V24Sta) TaxID=444157 RepID=B1YA69_PYRNV|nr:ATP-binding protein [Pyrobaculum neutrophilum]ACB39043.1 conserved hypothetical protein [Pyrobaculum neutrophilum V24Sta]